MPYTLQPCPFCRGTALMMDQFNPSGGGYGVTCENRDCGTIGPCENATAEAAAEKWNAAWESRVGGKGRAPNALTT